VLATPLIWNDTVRGVLAFFDHDADGAFTENKLNLVGVLAGQAVRILPLIGSSSPRPAADQDGFVDLSELL